LTVQCRAGGRQRERSFRHDQKSVANDFAIKVEHDKKGLGHKSVDLTYRTYSHFLPDAFDRARELLDAEFSDLS